MRLHKPLFAFALEIGYVVSYELVDAVPEALGGHKVLSHWLGSHCNTTSECVSISAGLREGGKSERVNGDSPVCDPIAIH